MLKGSSNGKGNPLVGSTCFWQLQEMNSNISVKRKCTHNQHNANRSRKTISALPSSAISLGIKYFVFLQNGIEKYSKAQRRIVIAGWEEEDDSCYTMVWSTHI